MPYTDQITEIAPFVYTYLWVTIWYKYQDCSEILEIKTLDCLRGSKDVHVQEALSIFTKRDAIKKWTRLLWHPIFCNKESFTRSPRKMY